MTKVALIYNTLNKNSLNEQKIEQIKDYFSQTGYEFVIYQTSDKKRCNDIINSVDASLFIIAGGDGTMNEVVNANINNAKILYIPTGTVNDFAASLKLSNDIKDLLKLIDNNKILKIDTGNVNNQKFNYVLASGSFSKISYLTPHSLKNKLGRFAYVLYALISLKEIFKHQNIIIERDGKTEKVNCDFIFITNSNSISSFRKIYRQISLTDGYFECLIVKKTNKLKQIYLGLKCLVFGIENVNSKHIIKFKFSKLKISTSNDVQWIIDGEKGPIGNVYVEVLKKNLSIYTSREE